MEQFKVGDKVYFKGVHFLSSNMCFLTEAEAEFADAVAIRAEHNGIGVNEFMHTYPIITRILKDKSEWAK